MSMRSLSVRSLSVSFAYLIVFVFSFSLIFLSACSPQMDKLKELKPLTEMKQFKQLQQWKKPERQQQNPQLQQAQSPIGQITQQRRALSGFDRIRIDGRFDVGLHTGYAKSEIILRGNSADLAKVTAMVTDNTLLLRTIPTSGQVFVEIRAKDLHSFTYYGVGTINGPKINSNALDLIIDNPYQTSLAGNIRLRKLVVEGGGNVTIAGLKSPYLKVKLRGAPRVQLTGVAKLSDLSIDGEGSFNLYWVSADFLCIRARGNSKIQLAGVANKLDMELRDSARFNGRYLRVSRTFVKTFGKAYAEINSIDRQHTLASGSSDIHFYNIPTIRNDFMAYCGAVLDMRDWNLPWLEEYTIYNKDIALGDWEGYR